MYLKCKAFRVYPWFLFCTCGPAVTDYPSFHHRVFFIWGNMVVWNILMSVSTYYNDLAWFKSVFMRTRMCEHARTQTLCQSPPEPQRVTNAEEKLPVEQSAVASSCCSLVKHNPASSVLGSVQKTRLSFAAFHPRSVKLLPSDNKLRSFGTIRRLQADKMCLSDKRKWCVQV